MGRLRTDYPGKFVEFSVGLRRGATQPNDGRDRDNLPQKYVAQAFGKT
jgi:hypothetical protein